MPDDTTKTGGQGRERISTSQDYELCDWAAKFGVTKEQLLEAVKQVGDVATDVEAHLKSKRKNQRGADQPSRRPRAILAARCGPCTSSHPDLDGDLRCSADESGVGAVALRR